MDWFALCGLGLVFGVLNWLCGFLALIVVELVLLLFPCIVVGDFLCCFGVW